MKDKSHIKQALTKTVAVMLLFTFLKTSAMDPRSTREITVDIDYTLTACCADIDQNFIGTFTSLNELGIAILGLGCAPTLITQASVGATGYTITQSGIYQLSESIVFSPAGPANAITINASDVILDLACFSIEQGNLQADVNGVEIVSTFSTITIRNGSIQGMTNNAILVGQEASTINISDMQILVSGAQGIFLNGASVAPIINVQITGLEFIANSTGVTSQFVQQALINECFFYNQTAAGVELINSYSHVIRYCTIADTTAPADVRGISAVGGGNNSFQFNIIDNTSTLATSSVNTAIGILLGSTENNDTILNNEISNSRAEGEARPANIAMAYTFTALSSSNLPTLAGPTGASSTMNDIDWSPDGRYLATASGTGGAGTLAAYQYDGTSLMLVVTRALVNANAVIWSPDGSYLAVGENDGSPDLRIFSFDGVAFGFGPVVTFVGGRLVNSADWSADGRFIALGLATASFVAIYEFSASTNSLSLVAQGGTAAATAIGWSPDGNYVAVGGTGVLRLYEFNGNSIVEVANFLHGTVINDLEWSSDGRYIVMGGVPSGGIDTRVLNFTGTALTEVASFSHGATVQSTRWSQDGKYVLLGGATSGGVEVRALDFLGTSLSQIATFANTTQVNSVRWAPTGAVVAIGSVPVAVSGISVRTLTGLQFGFGSTIRNNIITHAEGAPLAAGLPGVSTGRGLIGSSAANLIIQNTAFSNDINYIFVTNVFSQYVANTASPIPSLIANLSFPPL